MIGFVFFVADFFATGVRRSQCRSSSDPATLRQPARYQQRAPSPPARIGKDLMQGRHGPLAQLGGRGEFEERGCVGALGSDSQQSGPAGDAGGDCGGPQVGWYRRCPMASKEAQELHRFGTKPAANFDADDDQPTTARSVQLGVCLGALAARGGSERAARLDVGARVGLAASCEGRNDGGIQCELGAMPKGQDVRHDFDAPLVGDRNVKIHVCEAHVACDPRASFAADARDGMLQGQRTGGEHARRRTGGAVVAERVEHTVAAASARCEREGESQAPELRTGNGHVIAGGKNVEGAGGELPCLREQQRTRRRSEDASHTRAHRTHGQRRAAIPRTARGRQYGQGRGGRRRRRSRGLPILAPRNQHGATMSGCGLLRRPMARPRRPARQRGDGRPQQAPWPG